MKNHMSKALLFASVLLMAFVLVGSGCAKEPKPAPSPNITSSLTPAPSADLPDDQLPVPEMIVDEGDEQADLVAPSVKSFDIIAKQWVFEPDTITVNEGDTVKLSITSIDVAHGLKLEEFDVSERLEPNKTVDIEFVADKKGTFKFFCNVICGSGHGDMQGTLVVE